jgi:hypothetical protein
LLQMCVYGGAGWGEWCTSAALCGIRFDIVLANTCQEDRKQYCNDVQPVGGPVFCYNGFYALIVECLHWGRERCATGNRESEWVSQCGPCMLQSLLCTCRIGQGHAGATAC